MQQTVTASGERLPGACEYVAWDTQGLANRGCAGHGSDVAAPGPEPVPEPPRGRGCSAVPVPREADTAIGDAASARALAALQVSSRGR